MIALDPHARGLVAACAAAGLDVPKDLSLVNISEIGADHGNRRRSLSALVVDPNRMGRAAAAAMLAWLAGSRPAGQTSVQAASWEPRASTGAAQPTLAEAARR